jgi:hypothetical protein
MVIYISRYLQLYLELAPQSIVQSPGARLFTHNSWIQLVNGCSYPKEGQKKVFTHPHLQCEAP